MEQLSLLEESRAVHPTLADEEHVARVAGRIVDELGLQPPIDHLVLASYQGIAEIRATGSPEWAGCLIREGDRFVVYVRSTDGRRRQRYTACHEVGHTFLPDFAVRPRYRCTPGTAQTLDAGDEYLADVAAGELLMPRRFFEPDLRQAGFGLDAVGELAKHYETSIEATAHRLVSLSADRPLLVVLESMRKPADRRDESARPRVRAIYARGQGEWPFVPRFKSASDGSVLDRAGEGEIIEEPCNDLSGLVPGWTGDLEVSARLMPYRDGHGVEHRRVLALFRKV